MDDDIAERLDNLDLAVTQVADAVEVVATLLQALPTLRYDLHPVMEQLEKARQLIGTGDGGTGDGEGTPAQPAPE